MRLSPQILTTMISTTEPSDRVTIVSFGCSVTGPGNIKRSFACQDAWRQKSWRVPSGVASAIAIADGMGSRPESRAGAHAATRCALKAARRWAEQPAIGTDWLIRWLEAEWRYAIGDHDPKECSTTCWLIVRTPDSGTLVMGLGDGLAILTGEDGTIERLAGRELENYANETLALGAPHKLSDWKVRSFPRTKLPQAAILTTDGVADDILDQKLSSFSEWVRSTAVLKHPGRALRRALERWPVKSHTDDKTIAAIVWNRTTNRP